MFLKFNNEASSEVHPEAADTQTTGLRRRDIADDGELLFYMQAMFHKDRTNNKKKFYVYIYISSTYIIYEEIVLDF